MFRAIAVVGILVATVSPSFAQLYMDAGRTLYEFDSSGTLVASAAFDTPGHVGEGLSFGSDNRLYIAVAAGTNRVDSFAAGLTDQTNFVANFQGGLFVPYGAAFGLDGNLYVNSQGQAAVDRFFGPSSGTPGANNPSPGHGGAVWGTSVTSPIGLAFTPSGVLYASSQTDNGSIFTFDSTTGAPTEVASNLGALNVGDIAINAAGTNLYVRDNGQVKEFTINGDHSLSSVPFSALTTQLDGSYGLAFGPDGFLYATTRLLNGSLDPLHDADYVLRIDPISGVTSSYITGGINTFTDAQNPQFLRFAPVPEPSTLTLAAIGCAIGWCARRRLKAV